MQPPPPRDPVRVEPRILTCGHPAAPDTPEAHTKCGICFQREKADSIVEFERLHQIDVRIKGTPKMVAFARSIRHRVLAKLFQRIALEGPKPFLEQYVQEFRRAEEAKWFISRRFFSVDKLRGGKTPQTKPGYSDAFAQALAGAESRAYEGGDE